MSGGTKEITKCQGTDVRLNTTDKEFLPSSLQYRALLQATVKTLKKEIVVKQSKGIQTFMFLSLAHYCKREASKKPPK